MAGPQVTLTFGGDSKSLERTFDKVGQSAIEMGKDFGKAEDKAQTFGRAMDGASDAAGNSEGKFMGAADLLDGLGGAFGIPTEGATNLARSFGDMTGGLSSLGPSIGGLGSSLGALATGPMALLVVGVGAFVAALVMAYKNSETFRDIVNGAFEAVKSIVGPIIETIGGAIGWLGEQLGFGGDDASEAAEEHKQAAEKMQQAYQENLGLITGVLDSMADPFSRFSHNQETTLTEATNNLKFNVTEYQNWLADVEVILGKYGSSVATYVLEQGPKFHGVADQLANATTNMGTEFGKTIAWMQENGREADRLAAKIAGVFPGGGGGASSGHGASGDWSNDATGKTFVTGKQALEINVNLDGKTVQKALIDEENRSGPVWVRAR